MQRRIYFLICIAAFAVSIVLGEKVLFDRAFDLEIQGIRTDIESVRKQIASEQASHSKRAANHVKDIEKKMSEAVLDEKRKAEERQKEYMAEKMRLDRELATRSETVEAFAFASDAGHPELVDDLRSLEDGLARLRLESARLKRLHEAFNRRQFLSSSIRLADGAVSSIEEALSHAEGKLRDAAALSAHADAAGKTPVP